jgi:hypothetical protein
MQFRAGCLDSDQMQHCIPLRFAALSWGRKRPISAISKRFDWKIAANGTKNMVKSEIVCGNKKAV